MRNNANFVKTAVQHLSQFLWMAPAALPGGTSLCHSLVLLVRYAAYLCYANFANRQGGPG